MQTASGKILTGGIDANALHKPKRFFGAARNIEGGGSLTIINSLNGDWIKMDEVIFEELKNWKYGTSIREKYCQSKNLSCYRLN